MSFKVAMKNPRTGELKQVKLGFSWILFLWSGVFGLPLFLRRLHVWGGVFLALWAINLLGPMIAGTLEDALLIQTGMFVIMLALQIWLGIKGNEMTAKNYLEQGWEFANPADAVTVMAKGKWGMSAT